MQPTPTWSPTLCLVTSEPTAVTTPAISWPGTIGYLGVPHSPLTVWMSEWQMPANLMSNATSCGPTSRRWMVVLGSGSVADVAAMALTVVVIFSSYPLVVLSCEAPQCQCEVVIRAQRRAPRAIANSANDQISPVLARGPGQRPGARRPAVKPTRS